MRTLTSKQVLLIQQTIRQYNTNQERLAYTTARNNHKAYNEHMKNIRFASEVYDILNEALESAIRGEGDTSIEVTL